MTASTVLILFTLLFVKHFLADFLLQGPFQYLNKGTYGHPGGVLHSAIQIIGTFFVAVWFTKLVPILAGICLIEFLIHYHVDWAKMNLNSRLGLKPDNSEKFWWLLGFDQLLHYLTYSLIILLLM